jgi:geranylgeranyl diphosphate synthase type I
MSLQEQTNSILPFVEIELQRQIARLDQPRIQPFYEMLTYHMGWTKFGNIQEVTGKRIRPLILLLVTYACGGEWLHAVPAAAAVELVHNFSLVHDDIQDHSFNRHGRSTVWNKYGIPMAINVGDAFFTISNQAVMDLSKIYTPEKVIRAGKILHNTCLDLTCGQYLDMSYQKRNDMSIEDYWPMIEGKTAALLSACTQIGALLAGVDETIIEQYRIFGRNLGLAFQVQDDIIGVWGDEAQTGKSAASDILEGKNSLPILYGISQRGNFAQRWIASTISPEEVAEIAQMLKDEGALDFSQREAIRLTNQASQALQKANPHGEAGAALSELVTKLLGRQS